MSDLSKEEIEQLRAKFEEWREFYEDPTDASFSMYSNAITAIDELLAYRDAQGKAFAYYYPGSDTETEQLGFPHQLDEEQKRNCLPLYAAPQLPSVPDVWITYHPDTEDEAFIAHSESGSESCARRIAKEIGGYVVPVYHGDPSYE